MDLHKQWETTESNWIKERMELLDQFDNERKEWESQWKVMQKKIEELCQEVKLRRESKKNSCLKTVEQDKNVQSKMAPFLPHSPIPGQDDTAMLSDGLCPVSLNTDTMEGGSFLEGKNQMGKEQITMRKSKAVFMDPLSTKNQKKYEGGSCLKISEEERKSCTNALNTALEELAKVSEELCNFQEEIRKRSNHRRMKSTPFLQETISTVNPDVNHMISNDSPTALISLDTEKQINKKNLSHVDDMPHDTPVENSVPDTLSLQSNETPPIPPPRSTSRNFPSSYAEDHPVFDSLKENLDSRWETQDCRGKRSCSNNFPTKQHETTTSCPHKQNTLKDQVTFATSMQINKPDSETQCDKDLETNIWSQDINKLRTGAKSVPSTLWFPEVCPNPDKLPNKNDALNSSLNPNSDSFTEVGCNFEKISKNEKLAAKTDEFNRTVFRTDRCCSSAQHIQRLLDSSKDSKPCDPLCKCAVHAKESDDLCCIQNNSLSVPKEGKSNSFTKKVMGGQVKQAQEHFDASNYHHMLHEHDWKPSNLLGRPRSADPKSNYGVVEKLLKNYEKSTGSLSQNLKSCQDHWTKLDCNESVAMKSTDGKGFSRPARPTNRRPPSRWALRSPSAPPALKKTAYGYSFSLHSETAAV
uniref:SOGA 1/2-like coiled-coil domain-containing protein n=1 Tax=Vombatus ursinus TaxID=29139 RepID=A0A4X2M816_VOMUR